MNIESLKKTIITKRLGIEIVSNGRECVRNLLLRVQIFPKKVVFGAVAAVPAAAACVCPM